MLFCSFKRSHFPLPTAMMRKKFSYLETPTYTFLCLKLRKMLIKSAGDDELNSFIVYTTFKRYKKKINTSRCRAVTYDQFFFYVYRRKQILWNVTLRKAIFRSLYYKCIYALKLLTNNLKMKQNFIFMYHTAFTYTSSKIWI